MLASTPNSRLSRSTMISRCSSPMPEMSVWPLSSSVRTLNVGSSCWSLCRAPPSLSSSALLRGSIAIEITGSGKSMDSRMIGCSSEQRVSPVMQSRRPTAAAMSPACTSLISSRLFACICSRRPTRSRRPRPGVEHRAAGGEVPGVDAEERQLTHERVGDDLEGQRGEGLGVVSPAHERGRRIRARSRRSAARRAGWEENRPPRRAAAGRPCS